MATGGKEASAAEANGSGNGGPSKSSSNGGSSNTQPLSPSPGPKRRPKYPFKVSTKQADMLWYAIPSLLLAAGCLSATPSLWYGTLAYLVPTIAGVQFCLACLWECIVRCLATDRIQKGKSKPPLYVEEAVESALVMVIVACFVAWPVTQIRRGEPTAFKPTLEEASWGPLPLAFYLAKLFFSLLAADAWTFWKHYSLHTPPLYAFHKSHHRYHDPSTFAAFAIHPFEAVWTFCLIPLMCFPILSLYAPIHLPFLGAFSLLNHYLHCGYSIPIMERVLSALHVNTSEFHNTHHQLSVTHYGEMLTLWDALMGTHTGRAEGVWSKERIDRQSANVLAGRTSLEEAEDMKKGN